MQSPCTSQISSKILNLVAVILIGLISVPASADNMTVFQMNLVSNIPGFALNTDPNLRNPWGISNSATSPYWISDQGSGVSSLYNGLGTINPLVVTIPAGGPPSGPTGTVFSNKAGEFVVNGNPATFLFATLSGTIAGWNAGAGTTAVTAASVPGAVFTDLALANNGSADHLYAANFVSGGGVQVFDSSFHPIALAGSFVDPTLPEGYAPYSVKLVGGQLVVAYAQLGTRGAQTGAGLGYVSLFDTNGNFVRRLISNGPLNAPWGIALAPAGFGTFGNSLLVGNFGDGQINAFNPSTGEFIGKLLSVNGSPLTNSGLWAIEFGNGNAGSTSNTLFFTAGINGERDGLFGSLVPTPEPTTVLMTATGLIGLAGITRRRLFR